MTRRTLTMRNPPKLKIVKSGKTKHYDDDCKCRNCRRIRKGGQDGTVAANR